MTLSLSVPTSRDISMPESDLPSIIEFSVDLNEQDEPEPLPTGDYGGVIRAAVQKISQKGTRYGEVAFFVSPDQYPADYTEGNPDGTTLYFRRISFEDNPMARYGCRRFCESIGAPLSKKIDLSEWVGLEGTLEITHETYEGSRRANINRVRAA